MERGIDELDVIDLLTSLVEKSLVLFEERDREGRYRMLETVRDYAVEKLADGDPGEWRDRHLASFADWVAEAEPHLTGADQVEWLERLEAEHDNLRAAQDWAVGGQGSVERGLRLAGALRVFWAVRGHAREGIGRLEALLAGAEGSAAVRGKAYLCAGRLAIRLSDYDRARTHLEEALALARQTGDQRDEARAHNFLGSLAYYLGDSVLARSHYAKALQIIGENGSVQARATLIGNLANAEAALANADRAAELFAESIALLKGYGDVQNAALHLGNLGRLHLDLARFEQAIGPLEEALALAEASGFVLVHAATLQDLALCMLSFGDVQAARARLTASLSLSERTGDRRSIVGALRAFVALLAAEGHPRDAALIAGAADAFADESGDVRDPNEQHRYESTLAQLRDTFGATAFEAAVREGGALSGDQAIARCLAVG